MMIVEGENQSMAFKFVTQSTFCPLSDVPEAS
jgi:hypothetical protein